jgi:hypothetical protein
VQFQMGRSAVSINGKRLVHSRDQTLSAFFRPVAMCQQQALDHVVGAGEERWRHFEAESRAGRKHRRSRAAARCLLDSLPDCLRFVAGRRRRINISQLIGRHAGDDALLLLPLLVRKRAGLNTSDDGLVCLIH